MGDTPLHHLATHWTRNPENARACLQFLVRESGANLNLLNKDGLSPLHIAVKKQNVDACEALLELKSNVDLPTKTTKETPLQLACQNNCYEIIELFCRHGCDQFARQKTNKTAYNLVNNDLLMVKLLKKREKFFLREQFSGK
jgi:ankyrin repeat protein